MDPRMIKAAQDGDVDSLYALLGEDSYILEYVDNIPFINTPLHWAAIHGHTSFAFEILNLKPSFSMKLNQDGFSPMHLASTYGHLEVVKVLLKVDDGHRLEKLKEILAVDGDLCNLKGKGRMTPLHCASIAGHHDLLSWQDQEGNNVLHLAVLLKGHSKVKVVELLLHHRGILVRKAVKINSKNKHGFTALDLILMEEVPMGQDQGKVESILRGVGAKTGNDDIGRETRRTSLKMKWVLAHYIKPVLQYFSFRVDLDIPNEIRNALFIVVALIATATYQTGITPPGGLWQDTYINSGPDDPIPSHDAGNPIWYTYDPHESESKVDDSYWFCKDTTNM
ncbi:ankyrin repeat-containing protein BDA1-like [Macadamia integrifolia]|uniref:ankyrin repeat-containing protein BDA1-like n=1 Tax=Macadamia integrifolia TaxID=60698 RepID=UPI001C4E47D6|nr:ankyrin repeat-containing protein BDA1-like [Macadamia integrifolia]